MRDQPGECCEQDQSSEKEKTRPVHRFIPDTSKRLDLRF
jgi:hypothetical protein